MSTVKGMDLKVGDVIAERVRGLGQATVHSASTDADGVHNVYFMYGIELHFSGNPAAYWEAPCNVYGRAGSHNPDFELTNR